MWLLCSSHDRPPSAGSAVRRRLQCVRKAALRQFDFESVFALRLGIAQSGFGGLAELADSRAYRQRGLRFRRAPRLGSNSTEGDPDVTDISTATVSTTAAEARANS